MPKNILPIEDIIKKLSPETLERIVLYKANTDFDFEQLLRNAAMGKNEVFEQMKKEISEIKRSRRFYDWRSRGELYAQLGCVLQNIRMNIKDPEQGVELLNKFFALDEVCCNNCDDSDGGLGDIFYYEAVELFKMYTGNYQNKEKLTEICYELINKNEYGCHDGILDKINELLPKENIATLLEKSFEHTYIKPLLAFALRDAPLFEKLLMETRPNGYAKADYSELAKCWLDYGDLDKALSYVDEMDDHWAPYKKSDLLEEIFIKKGDKDSLRNIYCENYMRHPNEEIEKKVTDLFGEDFFNTILQMRIDWVTESKSFSQADMIFLMEKVDVETAEKYLLERKDIIQNEYFGTDFLKIIKKECSPLCQTVVFRVPLDYYLNNAKSKYYSTAASHLKHLIKLSEKISDWKGVKPHKDYFQELKDRHFRKQAFWRYFPD